MYVLAENNQIISCPYNPEMLRKRHPHVSFPEQLTPELLARYGVTKVFYAQAPEYDRATHKLRRIDKPVLIDDQWTITYEVVERTEEEITNELEGHKARVRVKRDDKLKATDWWGVSDRVMTDAESAYRQALRDIPSQEGFPLDVTWPDYPYEGVIDAEPVPVEVA